MSARPGPSAEHAAEVPSVHLESTPLGTVQDTFALRRSARAVADLLGADGQDAVRLATALSELGRGLLGADRLAAAFDLQAGPPAVLRVTLTWQGGHRLPEEALEASGRLLPTHQERTGDGGLVRVEQRLGPVPGPSRSWPVASATCSPRTPAPAPWRTPGRRPAT
ncbi:hypothetical protein [Kitasatospora fiedleri]|uniref:hypothetical protein n=1 Tax=Kitasatospora fiedleri TaxID=2991545 RepID=UPI00249A15F9|nr:hypothetical protein [Kitasatospora fiedleri]